ncbi:MULTISPECIES: hypothetical protein [Gordonia]|uniref:Uncharacterized protein n=1 Tax=Gordonia hongkongensis TaxID=1701090 RepID=A0ABT6BWD7_9ACTN|nr:MULTISPECIES: hypothetical protein [Gordonia]MCT1351973.1 hypothetical protein [Gordonia sp. p3-SID1431]MDF6102377.1 hypothetical protein [Gordonia hongkongensis]OCH79186.1 hypothetical protein A9310_09145 [Gordonia sp. UCD-TK1]UPG67777.1 hypothetical protein MVF96_20605 [Gordonia hongkongensis]WGJ85091.1 hypothetical protein QAD21_20580 [Gordonia sp. SMJS1]
MAHGKDIDAADWVDQDLLTRDESRDRLEEEIEFERNKLNELRSGPGNEDSVELARRRLVAMENLRDSL